MELKIGIGCRILQILRAEYMTNLRVWQKVEYALFNL